MSKITPPQNIPSELYDAAKALGLVARPDNIVRHRSPWSVEQPGTPEQQAVWDKFLKAIDCFAKQPDAGGAVPPAIGPRNRSWWFANDPGIPPIYYNYFMKETLIKLFADEIPEWCRIPIVDDTFVRYAMPNNNYGGAIMLYVQLGNALPLGHTIHRAWLKLSGTGKRKVHLYIKSKAISMAPVRSINVHQQNPATFDEGVITWNNQPALGSLLVTIDPPFSDVGEWLSFEVEADAICIKIADESIPVLDEYELFRLEAHETAVPVERPFYT